MILTVTIVIPDESDILADPADILASVEARLRDEAGYMDSGAVLEPTSVTAAFKWDDLSDEALLAICEATDVESDLFKAALAEHTFREEEQNLTLS